MNWKNCKEHIILLCNLVCMLISVPRDIPPYNNTTYNNISPTTYLREQGTSWSNQHEAIFLTFVCRVGAKGPWNEWTLTRMQPGIQRSLLPSSWRGCPLQHSWEGEPTRAGHCWLPRGEVSSLSLPEIKWNAKT